MDVWHPSSLPRTLPCSAREPLGLGNDYKPFAASLGNGSLGNGRVLVVAFQSRALNATARTENALLWYSDDGARTWSARANRTDLAGREWSLSVMRDGSVILGGYTMATDIHYDTHTNCFLFRSVDGGHRWTRVAAWNGTVDWNVVVAPDGKAHVGISNNSRIGWLTSLDNGATWALDGGDIGNQGWQDDDNFFSQSTTFMHNNAYLHAIRSDNLNPGTYSDNNEG